MFNKKKNLMPHERNGCSHNWIHNAGEQCECDICLPVDLCDRKSYKKDSDNVCNMYICTMCGEELWSTDKMFDIPHYRVREV